MLSEQLIVNRGPKLSPPRYPRRSIILYSTSKLDQSQAETWTALERNGQNQCISENRAHLLSIHVNKSLCTILEAISVCTSTTAIIRQTTIFYLIPASQTLFSQGMPTISSYPTRCSDERQPHLQGYWPQEQQGSSSGRLEGYACSLH